MFLSRFMVAAFLTDNPLDKVMSVVFQKADGTLRLMDFRRKESKETDLKHLTYVEEVNVGLRTFQTEKVLLLVSGTTVLATKEGVVAEVQLRGLQKETLRISPPKEGEGRKFEVLIGVKTNDPLTPQQVHEQVWARLIDLPGASVIGAKEIL